MSDIGRKIVAYHPEIRVRHGDEVVAIRADMDDFYEEPEVIEKLAAAYPGCKTMGDLVEAIGHQAQGIKSPSRIAEILGCCISKCNAAANGQSCGLYEWDEPI